MIMYYLGYDKPRPHVNNLPSVKCKSKSPEIPFYTWENGYNKKKNISSGGTWCRDHLEKKKSSSIVSGSAKLYKDFENQFDVFSET